MASSLLFLHFHLYWYEEPLRNWKKKGDRYRWKEMLVTVFRSKETSVDYVESAEREVKLMLDNKSAR